MVRIFDLELGCCSVALFEEYVDRMGVDETNAFSGVCETCPCPDMCVTASWYDCHNHYNANGTLMEFKNKRDTWKK